MFWGAGSGREMQAYMRRLVEVMGMLTILILVMVSQVSTYVKHIKLCTLNVYNLLYDNYASIKLFLKLHTKKNYNYQISGHLDYPN